MRPKKQFKESLLNPHIHIDSQSLSLAKKTSENFSKNMSIPDLKNTKLNWLWLYSNASKSTIPLKRTLIDTPKLCYDLSDSAKTKRSEKYSQTNHMISLNDKIELPKKIACVKTITVNELKIDSRVSAMQTAYDNFSDFKEAWMPPSRPVKPKVSKYVRKTFDCSVIPQAKGTSISVDDLLRYIRAANYHL